MKKSEVPQDDANMLEGKFKEPVYVLDENGKYTTAYSVGWDAKNAVMQHAWDQINEKVEQTRRQVLDGKVSPVKYYMEKNIMDTALLAKYTGFWRWTVKRHFKPSVFNKLNRKTLEKYAEVFNISVETLTDTEHLKEENYHNEH